MLYQAKVVKIPKHLKQIWTSEETKRRLKAKAAKNGITLSKLLDEMSNDSSAMLEKHKNKIMGFP